METYHRKVERRQLPSLRVVDTKVMKDMAALKDMYAKKEPQESPNNKAVNE